MIGNWRRAYCHGETVEESREKGRGPRYSIPYRCIAEKHGWDLTRVIPSCAVTGQAAGTAAALQAHLGARSGAAQLQARLRANGVPLDPALFELREDA